MTQQTKRHIPTEYPPWRKEVDGIVRFLVDGSDLKPAYGKGWFASMTRYYRERLLDLLTHWPEHPSCPDPDPK